MMDMGPWLLLIGCTIFFVGTVVGSFLNVCIYRIPWEKSVIWPGSTCPRCWKPIAARDNIPIVSWIALRGECRECGEPISVRYPLIELLVGLLFLALFFVDVVHADRGFRGAEIGRPLATLGYHALLVALLVAATFIDYDLWIIPDEITISGMILGVAIGTLAPWIRLDPAQRVTTVDGLVVGILGLVVGAGLTHLIRVVGSFAFRREAMGLGDVTLMGMIGGFLGWQAVTLTVFAGSFFGLAHALWKLSRFVRKLMTGRKLSAADRELPFGPYLSMGAVALVLSWPWLWPRWGRMEFGAIYWLFWHMLGVNVPFPE
jgi:leader peptidase (prepilin peptidase)/N-methyltransferase